MQVQRDAVGARWRDGEDAADGFPDATGLEGVFLGVGRCQVLLCFVLYCVDGGRKMSYRRGALWGSSWG